jgi:creatinine amidohydrolase/Fe(II)-dependent formamide hydrolase-like protein
VAHSAVDHASSAAQGLLGGGADANPEAAKKAADEMYDEVLQRLRRDLIHELEATGNLLRDNP